MAKIFVGTMRDGVRHCGIEYEEGTMTKEKWKIIKHAVDVYVNACEKIERIEELELAEEERELYDMNQKSLEKLQ